LRVHDPNLMESSLARTPTGGLVYLGALKKSLLQSMPYLVVLIIPFLSPNRREDFARLALLSLVPVAYLGFFAYTRDHGGLCLNLRFFLPTLPFTSILVAYAIRDLRNRWSVHAGAVTWVIVTILTVGAYVLLTRVLSVSLEDQEFAFLVVPMLIAGFLMALLIGGELLQVEGADLLRGGAWILLIGAFTWSALVAFLYDYPTHRDQRIRNYIVGEQVLRVIPSDSVFFTYPYIDPFMRLAERDRVRIVLPGQDQFRDFPRILEFHIKAGRRAYGVFPAAVWSELKEGRLASYKTKPIIQFPDAYLAEIVQREGSQAVPGS
jgi:hypothetical protein